MKILNSGMILKTFTHVLLPKNKTFSLLIRSEPRHKISNTVVCATSKGSDQPAHMRSLIRAFASRLNIL